MSEPRFVPFRPEQRPASEMKQRATAFYETMRARRSVRHFSPDPVPKELVELAIRAAATAPSGANRQPWKFVAVSHPETKREIRVAAEREEKLSYETRMPPEWIEALEPLGTGWQKPYLEIVPWIVVVFEEVQGKTEEGQARKNYYVKESVGIACGLFITALHEMGLATLTHTPSPMGFLRDILGRPANERPYILFPVGFPAPDATVPDIERKPLDEVAIWNPKPREGAT